VSETSFSTNAEAVEEVKMVDMEHLTGDLFWKYRDEVRFSNII